jgi:hypothetical protein
MLAGPCAQEAGSARPLAAASALTYRRGRWPRMVTVERLAAGAHAVPERPIEAAATALRPARS